MANAYLQVRVDETDKERASEILDQLGTNLSAVVNMLIKQIIITESIPFEIKMDNRKAMPFAMPAAAAAAAKSSAARLIEDPVIKGIREEYEGI